MMKIIHVYLNGICAKVWGLGSEPRPRQLVRSVAKKASLQQHLSIVQVFSSLTDNYCQYVTNFVTTSRHEDNCGSGSCETAKEAHQPRTERILANIIGVTAKALIMGLIGVWTAYEQGINSSNVIVL